MSIAEEDLLVYSVGKMTCTVDFEELHQEYENAIKRLERIFLANFIRVIEWESKQKVG